MGVEKMINIFVMGFNEEIILPFMIEHYQTRFPQCHITFFDNDSTDKTVEIARNQKCEIVRFDSGGKIDDNKMLNLKNNCWKNQKYNNYNWSLVCDPDELLDINEEQLKLEEANGTTIIKPKAYNMINMEDNYELHNIKYGIRADNYDKAYLFNSKLVSDIGYNHGCHQHSPKGQIKYNEKEYLLYHYKFINPDWLVERTKYTYNRLSDINKKMGWGTQWHITEEKLRTDFQEQRRMAIKVRQ